MGRGCLTYGRLARWGWATRSADAVLRDPSMQPAVALPPASARRLLAHDLSEGAGSHVWAVTRKPTAGELRATPPEGGFACRGAHVPPSAMGERGGHTQAHRWQAVTERSEGMLRALPIGPASVTERSEGMLRALPIGPASARYAALPLRLPGCPFPPSAMGPAGARAEDGVARAAQGRCRKHLPRRLGIPTPPPGCQAVTRRWAARKRSGPRPRSAQRSVKRLVPRLGDVRYQYSPALPQTTKHPQAR